MKMRNLGGCILIILCLAHTLSIMGDDPVFINPFMAKDKSKKKVFHQNLKLVSNIIGAMVESRFERWVIV